MCSFTLCVSIGYFIYDGTAIFLGEYFYFNKIDYLMLEHHFVAIYSLYVAAISTNGGFCTTQALFLGELSNPLQNIQIMRKWFYKQKKHKHCTTVDLSCQILFAFIFISMRFIFGVHLTYQVFWYNGPWFGKPVSVITIVLSSGWVPAIIRSTIKKFRLYFALKEA